MKKITKDRSDPILELDSKLDRPPDFAKMEDDGSVKLTDEHKTAIEHLLKSFLIALQIKKHTREIGVGDQARRELNKLIKVLEQLAKSMETRTTMTAAVLYGGMSFMEFEDERGRLRLFLHGCREARRCLARRSPDPTLPYVLESFESIYIAAGGKSTAVIHGTYVDQKVRRSRFIDFVWSAFLCLSEDRRPGSYQAVASAWETFRSKREIDQPSFDQATTMTLKIISAAKKREGLTSWSSKIPRDDRAEEGLSTSTARTPVK